jgi:hypothetical protein
MSISKKLNELNTKKQKIDKKISIVENRSRLKVARDRNKIKKKKKSLAKIFLASNYKEMDSKNIFSMYEVYTIGGLAILNKLENYKSSVLLASYNEIIHKCINNPTLKEIITNQGKENYSEDRKIKKDIEEKLYFINGVLIRAKEFILNSNLDRLHKIGNSQFIKMRKSKIKKTHKHLIEHLRNNIS